MPLKYWGKLFLCWTQDFLSLPSACGRAKLLRTELCLFVCLTFALFPQWCFLELPWGMYTYCEVFDQFFWRIFFDQFFYEFFFTNFLYELFLRIFWQIFFDKFFDDFFYILTIASFRIGVPSILFFQNFDRFSGNLLEILQCFEMDENRQTCLVVGISRLFVLTT